MIYSISQSCHKLKKTSKEYHLKFFLGNEQGRKYLCENKTIDNHLEYPAEKWLDFMKTRPEVYKFFLIVE